MTKNQKTEIFENYRFLIEKIAWKFHYKTGIEIEEIIAQGYLCFVECIDYYDEEKGETSTWIIRCIQNGLIKFIQKQGKHPDNNITDLTSISNDTFDNFNLVNEFNIHNDSVINAIGYVVSVFSPKGAGLKYGWLDKKINQLTGISFNKIWKKYPLAKSIIRGEVA